MTQRDYNPMDQQSRQYFRLGMQGGWTQGAKWTVRFLWVLGIAWVVSVIGINVGGRMGSPIVDFLMRMYLTPSGVLGGSYWEPLTSVWFPTPSLCALMGLWHILYLLVFGPKVERDWGSRRFLRFYLFVAYFSTLAALLLRSASPVLAGMTASTASAAIFGVMVAYAMMWPRDQMWVFALFPVPVVYIVLVICGIEVVFFLIAGVGGMVDFVAEIVAIGTAWAAFKVPVVRAVAMGGTLGRKGKVSDRIERVVHTPAGRVTPSKQEEEKDRSEFLEF